LRYITRQLRVIFGNKDETSIEAGQPIVRIYSHRSGAILRLRGLVSDLGENGGHFTGPDRAGRNREFATAAAQ
jgi:hypothetical protein